MTLSAEWDLIHPHQTSATGKPWEELVETSDLEAMRWKGPGQGGKIVSRIFPEHCRTKKLQSHIRMVTGSLQYIVIIKSRDMRQWCPKVSSKINSVKS